MFTGSVGRDAGDSVCKGRLCDESTEWVDPSASRSGGQGRGLTRVVSGVRKRSL